MQVTNFYKIGHKKGYSLAVERGIVIHRNLRSESSCVNPMMKSGSKIKTPANHAGIFIPSILHPFSVAIPKNPSRIHRLHAHIADLRV